MKLNVFVYFCVWLFVEEPAFQAGVDVVFARLLAVGVVSLES